MSSSMRQFEGANPASFRAGDNLDWLVADAAIEINGDVQRIVNKL